MFFFCFYYKLLSLIFIVIIEKKSPSELRKFKKIKSALSDICAFFISILFSWRVSKFFIVTSLIFIDLSSGLKIIINKNCFKFYT